MNRIQLGVLALVLTFAPNLVLAQDEALPTPARNPWHEESPNHDGRLGVRAVIEIPAGSKNKYEIDKATGRMKLDRVLKHHTGYPANYGFIPKTYAGDGDPLDVLVLGKDKLRPGDIISVRILGVMRMTDQGEADDKLIAASLRDPETRSWKAIEDVPPARLAEIRTFFSEYKRLEKKVVVVGATENAEGARRILDAAFVDYEKKFRPAPTPSRGFFANFARTIGDAFSRVFRVKPRSTGLTGILEDRVNRERSKERAR